MGAEGGRYQQITPYLHYTDVAGMLDWSAKVLGFEERDRHQRDGVVGEAEMLVGSSRLWLTDAEGEAIMMVWVDDVDAHYERVRAAGIAVDPPEDKTYWGRVRTYHVDDPEGHRWVFLQQLADT